MYSDASSENPFANLGRKPYQKSLLMILEHILQQSVLPLLPKLSIVMESLILKFRRKFLLCLAKMRVSRHSGIQLIQSNAKSNIAIRNE